MPVHYLPQYDFDLLDVNHLIDLHSQEAEETADFIIKIAKLTTDQEQTPEELFTSIRTVLKNFELLTGLYIEALDKSDIERYTRFDHNRISHD